MSQIPTFADIGYRTRAPRDSSGSNLIAGVFFMPSKAEMQEEGVARRAERSLVRSSGEMCDLLGHGGMKRPCIKKK